ncbi:MAG: antibiotic biosynthesis monooxygenase [Acidobacteria bacterium]|nr:antibiotic biosynthesis monooxygenase [Acidobacteriota bacterium]
MIIVSGRIYVRAGSRDEFLLASREAITLARGTAGCRDFVVAADPLDSDRVNVYEEWESEEQLLAFRGEGPGDDVMSTIVRADVRRHEISSSGPA